VVSIATGLIAGRCAAFDARLLPRETALGSLCHYISGADPKNYQPANITFDLLPGVPIAERKARHAEICRRAIVALDEYRMAHV
jgi:methylenetetrahydrofolate--tRNA-(uracil-5-)-methyltransferase